MKHVTEKIHLTILRVEGSGEFPIDMLRYDSCCPATEADSGTIERQDERRVVKLRRFSRAGAPATAARWQSRGWKVLSERPGHDVYAD